MHENQDINKNMKNKKKEAELEIYMLNTTKDLALHYSIQNEMPNWVCSAGAGGSQASSAPTPPLQTAMAKPTPSAGPGTPLQPPHVQSDMYCIETQLGSSRWRMWLRCTDCLTVGGPYDGVGSDPYDAARAQGWTK